jgi:hypothetical protein
MGPFRADGRGWRVFHACVRAWGSLPITSDKSDDTPLAERGFTHNAPLLATQVTAPSIPAPGSVLGSPPQAAGTNPGPIPVRLIWATVASWCPASTESGESVLKKFSLLRRLSLAWVGKAVASALERSFHDSHRTAVSPEIPPGHRAKAAWSIVFQFFSFSAFTQSPLCSRPPNRSLAPHAH